MYRRDRSVPFLAGTVPQLEPDAEFPYFPILEGKIISDGGGNVFGEGFPHKLPNERSLPDCTTAHKADLDKFINLFAVFLDNLQQRIVRLSTTVDVV